MHVVEGGAGARDRLLARLFHGRARTARRASCRPTPTRFAGFWIQESRLQGDWRKREPWATFLGASYFRAVGELGQVGHVGARPGARTSASAGPRSSRTSSPTGSRRPPARSDPVVVHSLLDGPSIVRRLPVPDLPRPRGVVMDIENHLFLRQDIERLGIAPLTSMFWYAEYGREKIADWRPEVHDSDGLAIWNGAGERIWRPLNNPTRIFHTSYLDTDPKGFGLIQRDRVFDHYLDGVGYDRRPSTWVEPLGDWGKGMVQLVEIPTDDEIHDNICRLLADRAADQGRRRVQLPLPPALGRRPARTSRRQLAQGGGDADGPRRPARQAAPARRLQVHGRVPGRHPRQPAVRRAARAGRSGSAAARSRWSRWRRPGQRAGPLAAVLRPHGRRPTSRSTCGCSSARATPLLSETWLYLFEPPVFA